MKGHEVMIACLLTCCLLFFPFSDKNTAKVIKITEKTVENSQVLSEKEAVIVMYSRDNCPPCLRWWEVERPRWQALGWRVEKVIDNTSSRLTPWFRINDRDGKKFDVRGFMDGEKFRRAKEGAR